MTFLKDLFLVPIGFLLLIGVIVTRKRDSIRDHEMQKNIQNMKKHSLQSEKPTLTPHTRRILCGI